MGFDINQNKLTIIVPLSVMDVIKRIHDFRVGDRETSTTKTGIAVELLKLGARIKNKEMDEIESGTSPYDKRIENQLAFIAEQLVKTRLNLETLFKCYMELEKINPDLVREIIEETKLNERDRGHLNEFFKKLP